MLSKGGRGGENRSARRKSNARRAKPGIDARNHSSDPGLISEEKVGIDALHQRLPVGNRIPGGRCDDHKDDTERAAPISRRMDGCVGALAKEKEGGAACRRRPVIDDTSDYTHNASMKQYIYVTIDLCGYTRAQRCWRFGVGLIADGGDED